MLASANANVMEALARLRVWDAVGRRMHVGDDFFEIAETLWPSERRFIVARHDDESRVSSCIPACVEILAHDRWDEAIGWLSKETKRQTAALGIAPPALEGCDRQKQAVLIADFVNVLFAQGRTWTGELAVAWQTLHCDPRQPNTFTAVLPQIAFTLEKRSIITNPVEQAFLRARLDIWWLAAAGRWVDAPVSIFRIADRETAIDKSRGDAMDELTPEPASAASPSSPSVVVMPAKFAEVRGLPPA